MHDMQVCIACMHDMHACLTCMINMHDVRYTSCFISALLKGQWCAICRASDPGEVAGTAWYHMMKTALGSGMPEPGMYARVCGCVHLLHVADVSAVTGGGSAPRVPERPHDGGRVAYHREVILDRLADYESLR